VERPGACVPGRAPAGVCDRRGERIGLLGERRVAADAILMRVAILGIHLDELPHQAWAHRVRMEARLPVGMLRGVAAAAVGRRKRALRGGKTFRSGALCRQGP